MKESLNPSQAFLDSENSPLGLLLRKAANAYRQKIDKALQFMGITAAQFATLNIISRFPNCSNADIARIADLTPQTVNLMVSKLLKSNSIQKKQHPQNKLIQQIEMTVEGQQLFDQCKAIVDQLERQIESGFSVAQQRVIHKWLASIIDSQDPLNPKQKLN